MKDLIFIGVTQELFNVVWNALPDEKRFWFEETRESTYGQNAVRVGNTVIWVDYLLGVGK